MRIPEILAALGICATPDSVTFIMEDSGAVVLKPIPASQKITWVTMEQTNPGPQPLYLQHPKRYYWYAVLPRQATLYLQYNACRNMSTEPFSAFTREVLNRLDTSPIRKLVIDLRFNGGGNSRIIKPLLTGIKRRPAINQRGHLFVIIGRRTFSSAILNAVELQNETKALLVGEPTGGKPNHYGEVRNFTLPYSGVRVYYSTKYFHNSPQETPSLIPDIQVEMSFKDYLNHRDPVLERILAY